MLTGLQAAVMVMSVSAIFHRPYKDSANKANLVALRGTYSLFKQTAVYAMSHIDSLIAFGVFGVWCPHGEPDGRCVDVFQ